MVKKSIQNINSQLKMLSSYIEYLETEQQNLLDQLEHSNRNYHKLLLDKKNSISILKSCLIHLQEQSKGKDILMEDVVNYAISLGFVEYILRLYLEMIHQKGGYLDKGKGYIQVIKEVLDSIY